MPPHVTLSDNVPPAVIVLLALVVANYLLLSDNKDAPVLYLELDTSFIIWVHNVHLWTDDASHMSSCRPQPSAARRAALPPLYPGPRLLV